MPWVVIGIFVLAPKIVAGVAYKTGTSRDDGSCHHHVLTLNLAERSKARSKSRRTQLDVPLNVCSTMFDEIKVKRGIFQQDTTRCAPKCLLDNV